MQALFGSAQSDNSGAVRKAYATTISALIKYAPEARINALAKEIVTLYESGDERGRFLSGLVAKELARNSAEAFGTQASTVSPPPLPTHIFSGFSSLRLFK